MVERGRADLPFIPALDGIRGVAVLGILLFHAGELKGGWLGVDLFFVLSGFLITSILLAEFEGTAKISISGFWIRRARRLIPGLFAMLIGVSLYAAFIARPDELARIRADGLATLFYAANWHSIYAGHEYWEMFRSPSPLDHTWSLAIEEQFYLLWPPLAYLVLRRSHGSLRRLWSVSLGLALLSAAWMAFLFDADDGTERLYFGTDTRAAATLLGAALASVLRPVVRQWPRKSKPAGSVLAWLGIAVLAWAWPTLDGQEPGVYYGGLFGLSLAGACTIAGSVIAPRGLPSRLFSFAPLRMLGVVSYGVYLWHWPIYLVLTPSRISLDGWRLTTVRIGVTLLAALASYRFLERPIRRGALAPARAAALLVTASAAVSLGLIAATTTSATIESRIATSEPGSVGSSLDLLFIGDSLAQRLAPQLRAESARRGLRSVGIVRWGCVILASPRLRYLGSRLELNTALCDGLREQWLTEVAKQRPRFVLILEGWPGGGEKLLGSKWHQPCSPAFDKQFAADLHSAVRAFQSAGSSPVLVTTVPPAVGELPASFADLWRGIPVDELRSLLERQTECQNRVRREVSKRTGAPLLDLAAYVCPNRKCQREIDGTLLRPDGIHFVDEGARVISTWLLDQIAALQSPEH